MENQTAAEAEATRAKILFGQNSGQWHHYLGYLDDKPCSTATLFENGQIAYLDWGHTLEAFRGRGCHGALIRQRLIDARNAGCRQVASVTDVGSHSARNLQSLGFRLAYNYVMLVRDPHPAENV